jgi:hypothetical protein
VDEEAINSDLDDSDTENEEDPEEATVETDIVFCTYDRVSGLSSSSFFLSSSFDVFLLRWRGVFR